jgi:hypothetical protein
MASKRAPKKPGLQKVARKIRGAPKAPKAPKPAKKAALRKRAPVSRPVIGFGVPSFLKRAFSLVAKLVRPSKYARGRKPLPSATIRALDELKAGRLTSGADADEMFRKLGITVVETKA